MSFPILFLVTFLPYTFSADLPCLDYCICHEEEKAVSCEGSSIQYLPQSVPSGFEVLKISNATIRNLEKNSFRKMDRLREIHFENCDRLETIEKFAFKGMKNLRLISFSNCPKMNSLTKGSFSGIGNQFGLRILINCPIHTIHPGVFRHAHNLREVLITGVEMKIEKHAFACIQQLDFLTLSGVSHLDSFLFTNSSRFHIIHLKESQFEIPINTFDGLEHIHQIIIQRSKIPLISTDSFAGLSTIETVELFDNSIGTISAHAFSGIVNFGRLRIARNSIRNMESSESILTHAVQVRFEENTVSCGCDIKWISAHRDRSIGDSNYCGSIGVHRTLRHYLRVACSGTRSADQYSSRDNDVQVINHKQASVNNAAVFSLRNLFFVMLIKVLYKMGFAM